MTKKTNLGEKCATWDCNGKVVRDKKDPKFSAVCNKCKRRYWIVERE